MIRAQFILAMEKRLLTDRFSLRFGTTMHGVLFTDSFFAFRYYNDPIADFREQMNRLAYSLMHNPDVQTPSSSPPKGSKKTRRCAPNSGGISSSSSDGQSHALVKLRALPNYVGGKDGRQRCIVCNKKTIWACLDCSDAPSSLFPLCPMQSNKHGNIVAHTCYDKHSASPLWMPKGRATTGGAKRRRASADDFELDVEEDCEDCELEDEEMAVDSD